MPRRLHPREPRPRRRSERTLVPRRYLLRLFGRKERYSKRFRRRIALAIALASAGAALAAWQGEEHARHAEEHDRDAFGQKIALEQAQAEIRENQLLDVVSSYARKQAAKVLKEELRRKPLATATLTPDDRLRIDALAKTQEDVENSIAIVPDALVAGPLTAAALNGLNQQRARQHRPAIFDLELALRQTEANLDAGPSLSKSDIAFDRSNDLLGDTALFILAAFFFTLAQISSRPRAIAAALSLGTAIGIASTALLVLWLP
jgi:hypothetical protein